MKLGELPLEMVSAHLENRHTPDREGVAVEVEIGAGEVPAEKVYPAGLVRPVAAV